MRAYFLQVQDKLSEIAPIISITEIDFEEDELLGIASIKGRLLKGSSVGYEVNSP